MARLRSLTKSGASFGGPGCVLFVTGRLAEPALGRVLAEMAPPFAYDVAPLKITVAALMTTPWIARFLDVGERGAGTRQDVGTGVVHPDIDPPDRLGRGLAQRADRRGVGDVALDHGGAATEALNLALDLPRALLIGQIGQDDVRPRAGGRDRDCAADAARPAGHEHAAAGERWTDDICHPET